MMPALLRPHTVMCLVTLAMAVPPLVAQAATRGDLTGDGEVGVSDAMLGLRIAVGLQVATSEQLAVGDINGDKRIDLQDVMAILCAAIGLRPLPQEPPPEGPIAQLQTNVPYPGGTRVQAPWVGTSFVVPQDWVGGIESGSDTFVFTASSRPRCVGLAIAIAALPQKPTPAAVAALLADDVDLGSGVVLRPSAQPQIAGDRVSLEYGAQTPAGPIVGYGIARVSQLGNACGFLIAGPATDGQYLRSVAEGLASSLRFSAPQLDQWLDLLANCRLREESGSIGGGANTTNLVVIELYRDWRFTYYRHAMGIVSITGPYSDPSGLGSYEFEEDKKGQWILMMDLVGPSFTLVPSDGSDAISRYVQLDANGQVYLDGQLVERSVLAPTSTTGG